MMADDSKTAAMTLAQFKKSGELDVVLRHWRDLEVPQDGEFSCRGALVGRDSNPIGAGI